VLCVDMDPQGNLTMSQGIDPDTLEKSMYDVLVHHISLREVIRKREVDVVLATPPFWLANAMTVAWRGGSSGWGVWVSTSDCSVDS